MIYFIRHGESQANADNVYTGSDQPAPLTEKGRQQAKIAGEKLKSDNVVIDNIISSTLERTRDTAAIIASEIGFDINKIQYDPDLIEYNVGSIGGKPEIGITPQQIFEAEGAEDPYEFQKRVMTRFQIIKQLPGNTLIVGHAGVGRMIEATKRGLDPSRFLEIPAYQNAQIVILD